MGHRARPNYAHARLGQLSVSHRDNRPDRAPTRLATAFFLNAGFAVIELAGGIITNSVAILADAVHDAGDALALGLAWQLAKIATRRSTPEYSYGFRRFTLLGALLTGVILVVGSLAIVAEAVPRLFAPAQPYAPGMVVLACLGIAVNGAAFLRLRDGGSLNERVVSWHFVEDILGWAAVLAASLVMLFVDLPILDPLLSLAIAAFVLYNVAGKIKSALKLFLEGAPAGLSTAEVSRHLEALPDVDGVHHVHVWSLDGEKHLATAHVVVPQQASAAATFELRRQAHNLLHKLGIEHATLEFEAGPDACLDLDTQK